MKRKKYVFVVEIAGFGRNRAEAFKEAAAKFGDDPGDAPEKLLRGSPRGDFSKNPEGYRIEKP